MSDVYEMLKRAYGFDGRMNEKVLDEIKAQGIGAKEESENALVDGNWQVRAAALRVLGILEMEADNAKIKPLLNDSHPEVRKNAIFALRKLKDATAIPLLLKSLKDPNGAIWVEAGFAVTELSSETTIPFFTMALNDYDWSVRAVALSSLSKLSSPNVLSIMKQHVQREGNELCKAIIERTIRAR